MQSPRSTALEFVWLLVYLVVGGCALWYTALASMEVYRWSRATARAQTEAQEWSVHPIGRAGYRIAVSYSFDAGGKLFEGSQRDEKRLFRNAWAAEQDIAQHKSAPLTIWYSPSNPTYSTPFRHFPYRLCTYAAILTLLALYFVGLRIYLRRQTGI